MIEIWKKTVTEKLKSFMKELETVCRRAGRRIESVKVVYATKYLTPEQFVAFLNIAKEIDIVPVTIGENRVQEAKEKLEYLNSLPHFSLVMIGNLQKNKINKAIETFDEIHAVDSLELARALDKRLERRNKGDKGYKGREVENGRMGIFLEVNVSGEKTKQGISPEELEEVIKELKLLKNLKLKGLMTMAPLTDDMKKVRPVFRKLRKLADRHNLLTSMGMSNDWQVAIEEGADMLRIGSRVFG